MSAVDEYRKARCNDLNEDPAFEQGRSFLRDYADEAIDELEILHGRAIERETKAKRERNELRDKLGQADAKRDASIPLRRTREIWAERSET